MADKIRKTIELRQEVIDVLQDEADKEIRPLKNHLEVILDKYAGKIWNKKYPSKLKNK